MPPLGLPTIKHRERPCLLVSRAALRGPGFALKVELQPHYEPPPFCRRRCCGTLRRVTRLRFQMCGFVSMHTPGGRRRSACSFISESVGFCVLLGLRRKTHPQRRARSCRENGCILLTCHAEARGTSAFGGLDFTPFGEMRARSILVELLPASAADGPSKKFRSGTREGICA